MHRTHEEIMHKPHETTRNIHQKRARERLTLDPIPGSTEHLESFCIAGNYSKVLDVCVCADPVLIVAVGSC